MVDSAMVAHAKAPLPGLSADCSTRLAPRVLGPFPETLSEKAKRFVERVTLDAVLERLDGSDLKREGRALQGACRQ